MAIGARSSARKRSRREPWTRSQIIRQVVVDSGLLAMLIVVEVIWHAPWWAMILTSLVYLLKIGPAVVYIYVTASYRR